MLMEIIFCSISSLLLLVTQVKTKASSKKMQLQEVIQKIKTQIKVLIYIQENMGQVRSGQGVGEEDMGVFDGRGVH